ncbi:hypothetical protein EJ03DRAFT_218612 [Teratosphaeria nubilosa]|uniref:Uncharacterized protein n=1 Tax=Teratosphaeria nubilosa TaxID=161662 RepID=A0A6G1KWZ3_9PEZI|nr:hypothetical protein EJ03DRAFT_218612 [Teratosphaeria nubilosa]
MAEFWRLPNVVTSRRLSSPGVSCCTSSCLITFFATTLPGHDFVLCIATLLLLCDDCEAASYSCFVVAAVAAVCCTAFVLVVAALAAALALSLFFLVRCLSEHALQVKFWRLKRRKSSTGFAFLQPVHVCVPSRDSILSFERAELDKGGCYGMQLDSFVTDGIWVGGWSRL